LNGRPPCHYCAQCGRGCISASNFSSSQVMIPPAQATGRFTLIPNAMAREIVVGKDGKAQAVSYIDKTTRQETRVYAKAFVLAASACESARLLLNSKSTLFPNGLANSSGVVGRYLTDSVGTSVTGYFPQLAGVTCRGGGLTARTIFRAGTTLSLAGDATCPVWAASMVCARSLRATEHR